LNEAAFEALGPYGAAIITGILGWLGARRRYSGQVEHTEASELWESQREYRDRLQNQVEELERSLRHEKLRGEFRDLRHRLTNHTLRNEIMRLQFLAHPDIPDEVKTAMLSRQTGHVSELEREMNDMKERLALEGIVV
jgi:hypothetical protein